MAETPQSLKNHARLDPQFHLVLIGLCLVALILSFVALFRQPGLTSAIFVVFAITLLWNSLITRVYSLKVQDRVIRLEERLRLETLLAEADKRCIPSLTEQQLIGLRFASDAELPALAQKAASEHLSRKQIKAQIQSWRADTFRV